MYILALLYRKNIRNKRMNAPTVNGNSVTRFTWTKRFTRTGFVFHLERTMIGVNNDWTEWKWSGKSPPTRIQTFFLWVRKCWN